MAYSNSLCKLLRREIHAAAERLQSRSSQALNLAPVICWRFVYYVLHLFSAGMDCGSLWCECWDRTSFGSRHNKRPSNCADGRPPRRTELFVDLQRRRRIWHPTTRRIWSQRHRATSRGSQHLEKQRDRAAAKRTSPGHRNFTASTCAENEEQGRSAEG